MGRGNVRSVPAPTYRVESRERGELKYKGRVLKTWPRGCRVEHIRTLVGETIEWDEVERHNVRDKLEELYNNANREYSGGVGGPRVKRRIDEQPEWICDCGHSEAAVG